MWEIENAQVCSKVFVRSRSARLLIFVRKQLCLKALGSHPLVAMAVERRSSSRRRRSTNGNTAGNKRKAASLSKAEEEGGISDDININNNNNNNMCGRGSGEEHERPEPPAQAETSTCTNGGGGGGANTAGTANHQEEEVGETAGGSSAATAAGADGGETTTCVTAAGIGRDLSSLCSDVQQQEQQQQAAHEGKAAEKERQDYCDGDDVKTEHSAGGGNADGVATDADGAAVANSDSKAAQTQQTQEAQTARTPEAQLMPNPLHASPSLLRQHIRSLRLDHTLLPLRPILSRLMSHPTYNRRGTFNSPVDADKLGLVDYHSIITRPMDLGTIKARLFVNAYGGGGCCDGGGCGNVDNGEEGSDNAIEIDVDAYRCHPDAVANDIRLTFRNALRYNPPSHPVHEAARNLWTMFEDWYAASYAALGIDVGPPVLPPPLKQKNKGADDSVGLDNGGAVGMTAAAGAATASTGMATAASPMGGGSLQRREWDMSFGNIGDVASAGNRGTGKRFRYVQAPTPQPPPKTLAEAVPTAPVLASAAAPAAVPNPLNPAEAAADLALAAAKVPASLTPSPEAPAAAKGTADALATAAPIVSTQAQSQVQAPPHAQGEIRAVLPNQTPTITAASASAARLSRKAPHYCASCRGRTCSLCQGKCLPLEPTLLICNGTGCRGAKIRKGAWFYAADDGTKQWCAKCYVGLPSLIPDEQDAAMGLGLPGKAKRDLLKRRNDEEVAERWVDCTKCGRGCHSICAMHDEIVSESSRQPFVCPLCKVGDSNNGNDTGKRSKLGFDASTDTPDEHADANDGGDANGRSRYTFVSGSDDPIRVVPNPVETKFDANSLPPCAISFFIERKVQERMVQVGCPANAEKTLVVRVISDYEKEFPVPDIVRRHFRLETVAEAEAGVEAEVASADSGERDTITDTKPSAAAAAAAATAAVASPRPKRRRTLLRSSSSVGHDSGTPFVAPPEVVKYHSKTLALFQRIDGVDVCIFCMYVQEYDGDDDIDAADASTVKRQPKRVYIAYLDSVGHFRPRSCRTEVYHEVLVAYLASARARGYETAHIWACPPVRGNSFVFWNHPQSQRTPSRDRLISWYHHSLSRAIEAGVVTDVSSLYEHSFKRHAKPEISSNDRLPDPTSEGHDETVMICPPILDGDMWIEEAVRLHGVNVARHLKSRTSLFREEGIPGRPNVLSNGNPLSTAAAAAAGNVVTTAAGENGDAVAAPSSTTSASLLAHGKSTCPAIQVADMLQDHILTHASSAPFRRPVNAAALKLKDYHTIITKPMDLGTVHTQTVMGEYDTLEHLVSDVELVFSNAMRYNPKGHFVHNMALEMQNLFFERLNELAEIWSHIGVSHSLISHGVGADGSNSSPVTNGAKSNGSGDQGNSETNWQHYKSMSMRLSTFLDIPPPSPKRVKVEIANEGLGADKSVVVPASFPPVPNPLLPALEDQEMKVGDALPTIAEAAPEETCPPLMAKRPLDSTPALVEAVGSMPAPSQTKATGIGSDIITGQVTKEGGDAGPVADNAAINQPPGQSSDGKKRDAAGAEGQNDSSEPQPKKAKPSSPKQQPPKARTPPPMLDLLTGGAESVARKMVGEDYWLFDKSTIQATKTAKSKGRNKKKRKKGAPSKGKSNLDVEIDTTTRKRRESWLGDDVGITIRKMRRDFFVCTLIPTASSGGEKAQDTSPFAEYAAGFDLSYKHGSAEHTPGDVTPGLADARYALLELLQQRNLEFNTLRKAKHSTAVILYYLHNKNAPGLIPVCSSCKQDICHLRWHRIKKPSSGQRRRSLSFGRPVVATSVPGVTSVALPPAPAPAPASGSGLDETGKEDTDLCQSCYAGSKSKNDYIPVRITFERSG